jgi:gamma-glutamyltranspeptidase / glutathione hydrolase
MALLSLCLATAGCSDAGQIAYLMLGGDDSHGTQRVAGFIGGVAADEPRAALVGREVLSLGGNAADAAVAMGFTLAATLPSRASLGAGGACLAYQPSTDGPGHGKPEAILFTPVAPAAPGAGASRPAAVPMLARGLYLLHARYGSVKFEQLISPAEQTARAGAPVSRALATDLAQVAGPLLADPGARAIFAGPDGQPLAEGAQFVQPDLADTLARLRSAGVGDLYQGALGTSFVQAADMAGGGLTLQDMRLALPTQAAPITLAAGDDRVAFLPPPADGGLAAAGAFQALQRDPSALGPAGARAQALAALFRARGGDPATLLASPTPSATLPPLPASTSFVVLDHEGGAVACALTMDNLFGTGRVAPGTGVLLAATPSRKPLPLLAAAIAWSPDEHAFRAAVSGSGQNAAGLAVGQAMAVTLRGKAAMPVPVPDPGRANVVACSGYLPDHDSSCRWATDPRGAGLAVGRE